jgi:dCMP deaminase
VGLRKSKVREEGVGDIYMVQQKNSRREKWDLKFLSDAIVVSRNSKDPSTKVGAIIARPDLTTASQGYNGFPRGVEDSDERLADRETKYKLVVHAEMNALITAREPLHGYTLYSTFPPCSSCAGAIIQAGIQRVVAIRPTPEQEERWGFSRTRDMFSEAGVQLQEYDRSRVLDRANMDGIVFIGPLL